MINHLFRAEPPGYQQWVIPIVCGYYFH